ncbi:hypothetical protein RIF29_23411 [Crotalaria pallida]|uniref:MULE transposase domain-containing protein n=1 Tax=Crotalaria pallida TaxID=3830 RepID=A0AAN9IF36_CROPI
MFVHIGYRDSDLKKIMWMHPDARDFEIGLRPLRANVNLDIELMCDAYEGSKNCEEIHLFFVHQESEINEEVQSRPHKGKDKVVAVDLVSSSSSSDDYDSVEDSAYRPPPSYIVEEDSDEEYSDEEEFAIQKKKKVATKPKATTNKLNYGPSNNKKKKVMQKKKDVPNEAESSPSSDDDIDDEHEDEDDSVASFEEHGYNSYAEEMHSPMSTDDEVESMPSHPSFNDASTFGQSKAFQLKTFNEEHTCCRVFQNKGATRNWVAKKLEKRLLTQPEMRRTQAYDIMKEEFMVHLNDKKVIRALRKAREAVEGSEKEQYGKLWDYLHELLRSNPGSKAVMNVIPRPEFPPLFERLYVCLDACKKGFKAGCRPLIGLDGCFLKGYYGGQLLSAVGQDANNQFYVIAYAVVNAENTDNWKWFLSLLEEDLGDHRQHGWNFISDQQKQSGSGVTTGGEIVTGIAAPTGATVAGPTPPATGTGGIVVTAVGNAPTARTNVEPTVAHAPATATTTTTYAASIEEIIGTPEPPPQRAFRPPPIRPPSFKTRHAIPPPFRPSLAVSPQCIRPPAPISSGTSSKQFTFVPTPGFKPPPTDGNNYNKK